MSPSVEDTFALAMKVFLRHGLWQDGVRNGWARDNASWLMNQPLFRAFRALLRWSMFQRPAVIESAGSE